MVPFDRPPTVADDALPGGVRAADVHDDPGRLALQPYARLTVDEAFGARVASLLVAGRVAGVLTIVGVLLHG